MQLYFKDVINDMIEKNITEKDIWVSSFVGNSGIKRNIKNVKPQIVKITIEKQKEKSYGDKSIYVVERFNGSSYDKYNVKFLVKAGKDNTKYAPSSLIIGSSWYDDENECKNEYDAIIYRQIKNLELEKEKIIAIMDKKIETLKKSFNNTDYLMEELINGK